MNTEVNIGGIRMKNPVMTASGTFGYGEEYSAFFDLDLLGALVSKGVSLEGWDGNPQPRICETESGMINSIGLQNKGVEWFLQHAIPFLEQYSVPLIVNISEKTKEGYAEVADRLSVPRVGGLEVNVSCPNVKEGGMAFGTDPKATYEVVGEVRKRTMKPIIVKLSPNVTNIVPIAKAAEDAGADAISLINTLRGMAIDVETRKPRIHGKGMYMGGLSGNGIRPNGVALTYQIYKAGIKIPLVGMGGISRAEHAIEYILAGATAVAVGTATFGNPLACVEVVRGIEGYMLRHNIEDINDLRGKLEKI